MLRQELCYDAPFRGCTPSHCFYCSTKHGEMPPATFLALLVQIDNLHMPDYLREQKRNKQGIKYNNHHVMALTHVPRRPC